MTTPTGLPAWTRSADYIQYGGDPSKANYQSQGVVNPRTDVGAEGFSRLVADAASVVRTAEFASMQILCVDGGSNTPIVENCRLMVGVTVIPYAGTAPPGGVAPITLLPLLFPIVTRVSNGSVQVTFPASYIDEYGVAGAFIVKEPIANFVGAGGGVAVPEIVSATVVNVRVFDLTGVAISGARFTLSVGSGT